MGADFAQRLAAVLLRSDAHFDGAVYKCYWPHHVFRIWSGGNCVDVVICFGCHNFAVVPLAASEIGEGMDELSRPGTKAYAELQQLAWEAFPNDKHVAGSGDPLAD